MERDEEPSVETARELRNMADKLSMALRMIEGQGFYKLEAMLTRALEAALRLAAEEPSLYRH